MQISEVVSEIVSEMHALIQFTGDREDAKLEAMKCELELGSLYGELGALSEAELLDAARRGVQRVLPLAQA